MREDCATRLDKLRVFVFVLIPRDTLGLNRTGHVIGLIATSQWAPAMSIVPQVPVLIVEKVTVSTYCPIHLLREECALRP